MRHLALVLAVATTAACGARGSTAVSRSFHHEQRLRDAVVYIRECGTGWLVSESYVVTNAHVIACLYQRNHRSATIDFSNGTQMQATFAGASNEPYVDLALLRLEGSVESPVLRMDPDVGVKENSLLISMGNPSPVTWMPTTYRVVKQPDHVDGGLDKVLILEGLALHGNSGSPVIDLQGRVVGTIFARAPGYAYAIPVQPYLVTLLRSVAPRQTWP
jgi:S1-C subfamily serine protease